MTIKNLSLIALALALLAPSAAPAFAADPDTKHRTELISETSVPLSAAEARAFFGGPAGNDRFVITGALIVMAGAKVWSVIIKNRPSADLASAYASAIPGFAFNWDDLKDWRKVTRKYRFTTDNLLQGRAVDIVYEVSFFHGAVPTPGAAGRKGHYITNFTVKPLQTHLKWGWKVSLEVAMSDPMNVGTKEEPVAWLNADLKWQYAKPFTTDPEIGMNSLTVDGMGKLSETSYGDLDISALRAEETVETPAVKWD